MRALIDQLDISARGSVTILYRGKINENLHSIDIISELVATGQDVRILDNTEVFRFLDWENNPTFEEALVRIFNSDPGSPGSTANQFLQGQITTSGDRIPNGAWDIVSKNFVEATVGEVRTIAPGVFDQRVFGQTELIAA